MTSAVSPRAASPYGGLPGAGRAGTSASRAHRPLVAAVDIGTSSIRAGLFDARGRALQGASIRRPYAVSATPDGGVTVDATQILRLAEDALDGLTAVGGSALQDVRGVAISSVLHSLVGLDRRGRPLTPMLTWADTTSHDAALELCQRLDDDAVHQRTGAPLRAGFWPARIRHLRRRVPGIHAWAGLPDLLMERLTGRRVVGRSIVSGTGLFDRVADGWDAGLCRALDLDPATLPRLVDDGSPIGSLVATNRSRWPDLGRASWFPAWSDAACGNVGSGAIGRQQAALMIGTSAALRVLLDGPAEQVPPGLFAFRLGGERTLIGAQLSEGGGVLSWLTGLTGSSRPRLEHEAALLAPDVHGLTVLPFAMGERSLGYRSDRRAVIEGLSLDTTPVHLFRAFQEAIAYRIAAVDARLSAQLRSTPRILASGGALRRSPALVGLVADVIGRDIEWSPIAEPSSRGAALLALGALGIVDPFTMPPPRGAQVVADPDRYARYAKGRERHDRLYDETAHGRPNHGPTAGVVT